MEQETAGVDPTDLFAAQEADAHKAETDRRERELEVEDLKWLMGHRQGRRIVWRKLQQCGVFQSSFSVNPIEMAFREGVRNAGLRLIADINEHCANRYNEMLKENKSQWPKQTHPQT
jgi:hypothetical protein